MSEIENWKREKIYTRKQKLYLAKKYAHAPFHFRPSCSVKWDTPCAGAARHVRAQEEDTPAVSRVIEVLATRAVVKSGRRTSCRDGDSDSHHGPRVVIDRASDEFIRCSFCRIIDGVSHFRTFIYHKNRCTSIKIMHVNERLYY